LYFQFLKIAQSVGATPNLDVVRKAPDISGAQPSNMFARISKNLLISKVKSNQPHEYTDTKSLTRPAGHRIPKRACKKIYENFLSNLTIASETEKAFFTGRVSSCFGRQ
jgi:hypothetical protein